ncbi:MAG: biopolymer transporter ExbD [Deltaproteobacteria bacterium]|nr:biopolymer transporter ExbD [Deltaproteobacteria bacterium]
MKIIHKTEKKARIEMLPLIDIVFLLLVFFIYAMLSMAVHRGLPVSLPSSSQAEIDKSLTLSVTINADGSIYLDDKKIELKTLANSLMSLAVGRDNSGVLLFADKNVSYQNLFQVMDQIRMAGITRVSLQAEVEKF